MRCFLTSTFSVDVKKHLISSIWTIFEWDMAIQSFLNFFLYVYAPPLYVYAPPPKAYAPLSNTYVPPSNAYAPPPNAYARPPEAYAPPSKAYSSPLFRNVDTFSKAWAPLLHTWASPSRLSIIWSGRNSNKVSVGGAYALGGGGGRACVQK